MVLPLALYDRIQDPDNDVWKMILLLRELSCILYAPALSSDQIDLKPSVTNEYIYLRTTLFEERLRPKHEYIMHYYELIKQFGPLNHIWTLKFEAKHSYFRSIAESLRNFKNIEMTLAAKNTNSYRLQLHLIISTKLL